MAAFRTCLGPDGRRALTAALDGKFSANTDSVSWHAFETALTESGVELGAESEKTNLLRNLSYAAGVSCSQADCLAWLRGVLEGGLVDPFAELRPTARGRFTCWNQQQNQRFNNCGRRIDYTLVDREVFERWVEALRGDKRTVAGAWVVSLRGHENRSSPLGVCLLVDGKRTVAGTWGVALRGVPEVPPEGKVKTKLQIKKCY